MKGVKFPGGAGAVLAPLPHIPALGTVGVQAGGQAKGRHPSRVRVLTGGAGNPAQRRLVTGTESCLASGDGLVQRP